MFLTMLVEIGSMGGAVLEAVAGNVVVAGGMWRVKGMQGYFRRKVLEKLEKYPKLKAYDVKNKISMYLMLCRVCELGV